MRRVDTKVETPYTPITTAQTITGVELDLISDPTMQLLIERSIRGGSVFIGKRFSEANCPEMGDKYDPTKPTVTLQYLDANKWVLL